MHDQNADAGGNAGQLRRAIDLGIVHIQASRQTTGRHGLPQAVKEGIQSLVGIELGMGNEPAGVLHAEAPLQEGFEQVD